MSMREVEEVRADIDQCDEKLLSAFLERVRLVREIARAKAKVGLQPFDTDRERVILQRASLDLIGQILDEVAPG